MNGTTDIDSIGIDERALRVLEFYKVRETLSQKCVSSLGRQYVEELVPSVYESQVRRDLAQTTDAESFIIRNGTPPLGSIHDIRGALKRIELGANLNLLELLNISSVLRTVRGLQRYAKSGQANPVKSSAEQRIPVSAADADINVNYADVSFDSVLSLIQSLVENHRLENHIDACIINEEEIADDASPALASIRRQIRRLQDSIKDKLNAIIRSASYQKYIQDSIVTIRHDRYVIPVKQEHRHEINGLVHDMSSSGATVFVEPMAVVEANNEIREQKVKEVLEVDRILAELTAEAAAMEPYLTRNVGTLALLDFLFAKAKLSLDNNCTAPVVSSSGRIKIKRGRHPLLDKKTVVPMNFWMSDGINTVVITGPNTGGKTVALKTVGLLTLMAQAGLHIPAESGSSIRVYKNVFADIGDEQSIEQSLSTFSSHMKNIVSITRFANDETLALFDEIGAGTDPTEGAAIAMSILECLHQTGTTTVATTHYSELKVYALTTMGIENACCEFDVATLKPTYRLLIGVPGKSNAFAISARLGLAPAILARAKEFLTDESVEFEEVLQNIGKSREQTEIDRLEAQKARRESEALRDELLKRRSKLSTERDDILRDARETARRILQESRREVNDALERLKKLEELEEVNERKKGVKDLRDSIKKKLDRVESELSYKLPQREGAVNPPKLLKEGDTVEVVTLRQRGTVESLPDKSGNALVRIGIMSVTAHVSNLRLIDEQSGYSARAADSLRNRVGDAFGAGNIAGGNMAGVSVFGVENNGGGFGGGSDFGGGGGGSTTGRVSSIRPEIDVRGMRKDEAVSHIDRWLDGASLTGLSELTIIHGKGTGALRSGIQQYLRGSVKVKSFRNGNYGEGDMGVTVISLK